MFEMTEEAGLTAMHHPFTAPKDVTPEQLIADPMSVYADAYDLVINGYESGGGSVRIYDENMQNAVFTVLGISKEEAREKFGFLLDALSFGAPPHAGLALWLLLFVIVFISSKNTQYKRIGDTDFYLMHDNLNREGPSLFCNIKKGAFKGVSNSGKIEDVYWNKDYILLECTKSADYSQHKIFCIIKQHVKSKKHDLPWRIFLFADKHS